MKRELRQNGRPLIFQGLTYADEIVSNLDTVLTANGIQHSFILVDKQGHKLNHNERSSEDFLGISFLSGRDHTSAMELLVRDAWVGKAVRTHYPSDHNRLMVFDIAMIDKDEDLRAKLAEEAQRHKGDLVLAR